MVQTILVLTNWPLTMAHREENRGNLLLSASKPDPCHRYIIPYLPEACLISGLGRAEGYEGMTCLHQCPEDLRIHDWELHEDILLTLCRFCSKVLGIEFDSRPGETQEGQPDLILETIY
ncbi:MAG: hypothetical protein KAJ55_08475 [Anaerolineales bacterium]|nr:hypothetical protein [Anaerolineales bacterium]